jgi:hypothetical protein
MFLSVSLRICYVDDELPIVTVSYESKSLDVGPLHIAAQADLSINPKACGANGQTRAKVHKQSNPEPPAKQEER